MSLKVHFLLQVAVAAGIIWKGKSNLNIRKKSYIVSDFLLLDGQETNFALPLENCFSACGK